MTLEQTASFQPQAYEAIMHDTVALMALFLGIQKEPHSGLLTPVLLPIASMYVVESYQALKATSPKLADTVLEKFSNRLHPLRHRAKLLDDLYKSVNEVAFELVEIAEIQEQSFMKPHKGFLGFFKRALQPDLGLSIYEGHIFNTTHATIFNFGNDYEYSERAYAIGEAMGAYASSLAEIFDLPIPKYSLSIFERIEVRDIKSDALYKRKFLDQVPLELAVGITFLLASVNSAYYVIRELLPNNDHTQFRLKFIAAYHADSSLRSIQAHLNAEPSLSKDVASLFRNILGNSDSRWLRKQKTLRNLLVHYNVDKKHIKMLPANLNRKETIEFFAGKKSFVEIDALLDRHLQRISQVLEDNCALTGDPFWYGRVRL